MAIKKLFCDNWIFSKQDMNTEFEGIKNIDYMAIDIPHDWLIHQTANLYESSNGIYKKNFTLTGNEPNVAFRFEGVYMNSSVYINGELAFEWKYGYSTFEFDAIKFVHAGENEMIVIVRHHAPNSRWYSGAGIFRPVYMIVREKEHFTPDGIYFSAFKNDDNTWNAEITWEVVNSENKSLEVKNTIVGKDGNALCTGACVYSDGKICFTSLIPDVWDIKNPAVYTLVSALYDGDILLDEVSCNVGFRKIEFTHDGFFLNGRQVKFNGVCLHHDLGALGAAFNKAALKRQLLTMMDMGVNAVRTSHNMPAKEMMELADELGILICSEAFDMWQLSKTKYDYARFFDEYAPTDVESWVRRDRNHPSVIMWSIGNEIYDTHCRPEESLECAKMLNANVLKHDPNKNASATIGSNYMWWEPAQNSADVLKVVGYNYIEAKYEDHHNEYPDWFIYGSETASRVQSRGIYHFPASQAVITYEDIQCSCLENSRSGQGDRTVQYNLKMERDTKFSGGQFIWTGTDYLGEPSPYWTKNSYFGQVDTAGFKKDQFYIYESMWKENANVLHIFPYWDFNDGQLIDVFAYTTCAKVELYLDDELIGTQSVDLVNGETLNCSWQLPYKKGTLKAIGYDKDGNKIAEDIRKSFGDGEKIILNADKTSFNADGEDLVFVTISTIDKNGTFVANARSRMNIEVTGAGRLVGLDNGDSTDYDEFKGTSKKLFSGMLVAIIAAKTEAGECKIKVSSKGFEDAVITLNALPCEVKSGISCIMENVISTPNDEVPVRKIELKAERLVLDKEHMTSVINYTCYPLNCDKQDIIFKAVTNSGIETNIASVEVKDGMTLVTAIGDGEFRLRAACNNGKENPEVLSDLEFKIEGIGSATFDPYSFVPASIYNASSFVLDDDLDGGIKASPEMTYIGFRNVDFGEVGSKIISIPIIHWHTADPLPIEVWKGMPYEDGAVCIYKGEYNAEFIWQTYQENTFELSETLTGLQTICIAVRQVEQRVSVKGFIFEKNEKAYSKLMATANNRVFGDSFEIDKDRNLISHIGNNVSVEFDDMDFTNGFKALTIRGKTYNQLDSLHVILTSDSGTERRLVEFKYSEEMTEKTFKLDGVTGVHKITFWFLPGCNFDFEWFRFE